MNTRDDIRQAIFDKASTRKRKIVTFLGVDFELLQPNVAEMLALADKGSLFGLSEILIRFAYVPGTEIRVFESADKEMLENLPFSTEVRDIVDAFNSLSFANVGEAEKN
jgi:hypothetical protein